MSIILLFICNSLYADGSALYGSTLRWSYIVNRYVLEGVSPFFTNADKERTDSVEMTISSGLEDRIAHLGISTNRVSKFDIKLTFYPMKNTDDADTTDYYYYARVYVSTDENAAAVGDDLDVNACFVNFLVAHM